MSTAYLNGQWTPLEATCVSVLDRGFLFGDGVYEVIPVYAGCLFLLQEHLARLERSMMAVGIDSPCDRSQWVVLLEELVARNEAQLRAVYLQVTRGTAAREHAFPRGVVPTVLAMALGHQKRDPAHGMRAVIRPDNRWARCDIKAITLLPNVLLRQQASAAQAEEAILSRDGLISEGAASNVFIVHQGQLLTPARGPTLLAGITRALVMDLASAAGYPCSEASISETQLRQADEVWLTASTMEIVPVVEVDGHAIGQGRPGPVWEQMYALFRERVNTACSTPRSLGSG